MTSGYVHPDFGGVADRFTKQFSHPDAGGAACAVFHHGEKVVDIWGGSRDTAGREPWEADTMAMSFSTTKGIASTAVHVLVDRGQISYDEPVATYWPEFAQAGKAHITVRDLLTHRAGLHRLRGLVSDVWDLLDHHAMADLLAGLAPEEDPERRPGYHAITYGWLIGRLVEEVTGQSLGEFVASEVAKPLELDGLYIGTPPEELHRVAPLFPEPDERARARAKRVAAFLERFERTRPMVDALVVEDFDQLLFDPERRILATEMPAVNGVFTARSLAKLYSAYANGGEVDGHRLLSAAVVDEVARTQTTQRDRVLLMPMQWRIGFHRGFVFGRQPKAAFGHFGYGGSGGWADPETRLSVGLVLNRLGASTPVADVRLARLGAAALSAARRRGPETLASG